MAIATKPKPTTHHHKKRTAKHHKQTKHYAKSYWPYLPMLAVLSLGILVNSVLNRPTAVLGVQSQLDQYSLVEAANERRISENKSSLTFNEQLKQAAQAKADDMVKRNYWSHNTPDGQEPWKFVVSSGYQYQTAGENLAYGFDTADEITDAWMRSAEHRANLLDTSYMDVGFGVAQSPNFQGGGPETIVVAMYARPTIASSVTPATKAPLQTEAVRNYQTMALPLVSSFILGAIAAAAVVIVVIRHSLAWHRIIRRGERFILRHPLLDSALVGLAMTAAILGSTTGFIS